VNSLQYTEEQLSIIQHTNGHARIIAVAGSGKTQTLTAYVVNRLAQGVSARRLLVLMYNKSAQIDFERRLNHQLSGQRSPDIRTFHSLGYRICQTLVKQGDMPKFKKDILSDSEIEIAVWRILRHLADEAIADDVLSRKKKWVEPAVAYFELVKSSLESPEVVFEKTGLPSVCKFFVEAFYRFEDWRSDEGRLSFSDLIYEPVQRFRQEPHLRSQFSGHLAEIVVDEYQDINSVQQFLLEVLSGETAQVILVGDPDQTIYEFRGSEPKLLTHLVADVFSPINDFQLSHTFRFGDSLSLLANQIIASNYSDPAQRTHCVAHDNTPSTVVTRLPFTDSAMGVVNTIQRWAADRPYADIAVINRLWANSARLELLLLSNGIPYHLDNQHTVLERYELRPFRVLLQLASGATKDWDQRTKRLAWQALLTQPFLKIKKPIVDQIIKDVSSVTNNWGQSLRNAVPNSLSTYQSEALFERARWIEKAERAMGDAYPVIQGWLQSTEYLASLKEAAFSASQVEDQVATVKAFASFVRQAKWSLANGAAELTDLIARKTPSDQDALLITSIHKSKGREWPCVVIPEVNNRYFPYQPDGEMTIASSVESERRLLYVAVTRAAEELVLVTPGPESEIGPSKLIPDAFIDGLKLFQQCIDQPEKPVSLPRGMHRESVLFYAEYKSVGTIEWQQKKARTGLALATIRHPNLGLGTVLRENEKRITIEFVKDGRAREFDRAIVLPLITILSEGE
jgi:DNA helicase-2/ATP-dependent DNA helicase PcrA